MNDDSNDEIPITVESSDEPSRREKLETEAERAVEGLEDGVIDLLAWLLDTETRSRIYIYLRKYPASTSEEVAEGTGLYPSTVREALVELHDEGTVTREKRETAGAGNNPYEYQAIAPSDLVGGAIGQLQDQLNALVGLDRSLGDEPEEITSSTEPITIDVDEPVESADADEETSDEADSKR